MRVSRHWLVPGSIVVLLALASAAFVLTAPGRTAAAAISRRVPAALARFGPGPAPPPASVTIVVDPSHVLRPISPLIYGVAHANPEQLIALGASLNRWGGNPNTRHNWEISAWNAARDWEFRNYGQDSAAGGSAADHFVAESRSVGAETEITVPAIGWIARNGDKETRSVGVASVGGPPLFQGSDAIAGYDPADNRQRTSVPSFARRGQPFSAAPNPDDARVYQDEWVHHLVTSFGSADNGGVRYYVVDNEPDLWSSTHTDVHPVQMSYDDTLATFLDYATAIKDVDPHAQVAGPALSGWTAYFYSALDQGQDRYRTHADRVAHGDMPFLPWWLDQVHKHDQQTGQRTLDVLDLHYYPQEASVFSAADDPQTRGLRLRSTRSLWDPSYTDESWIGDTVQLIPRMREWVDQYYPGTKLAIGEWSWGGEKSMSGALAVADVLGIFGRAGVDLASYWTFPPLGSPAAQAFALYTHYNDRGDAFGDEAIPAILDASPNYVTAYASIDSSTGDVVLIAINKRFDAAVSASIRINGAAQSDADVYRLADGDTEIRDIGTAPVSNAEVRLDLAASSLTLVRIRTDRPST
jgi:hypothetical protein